LVKSQDKAVWTRHLLAAGVVYAGAAPVLACDVALALTIDVSGSVDRHEYVLQMKGLADALRDPTVADALVAAEAAVTVVQWTGVSRQKVTLPWVRISEFAQVGALADQVEATPRSWRHFSTAIGSALRFTAATFDAVPDCTRRVIDVSGDGVSNEGVEPVLVHAQLRTAGITVNGLAIEGSAEDLTAYYWENVMVGDPAFVMTANDFDDYPERIKRKLLREVTRQVSSLP